MVEVWNNCWQCGNHRFEEGACKNCSATCEDDPLLGRQLGPARVGRLVLCEPESNLYSAGSKKRTSLALRVLPHKLHGDTTAINNFIQVARRATTINNPNITRVLKHGVNQQGVAWMLLEWPEGEDLNAMLRRHAPTPLPIETAHKLSLQMLEALQELHAARLVHGRISPFALQLASGPDEQVRLIHCGHAWMRQSDDTFSGGLSKRSGWKGLRPWAMYRAPSLFTRGEINEYVDLYSLGVCLYQVFTGKLPYRVNRDSEILKVLRAGRKLDKISASDRRAELSRFPKLQVVLSRALDERVDARYASVRELREDMLGALVDKGAGKGIFTSTSAGRRSSRASARENITHRAASRKPQVSERAGPERSSRPKVPGVQLNPVERPLKQPSRGLVSRTGVRFEDLRRLNRTLSELTHEVMAIVSPIDSDASLQFLEAVINGEPGSVSAPPTGPPHHTTPTSKQSTGALRGDQVKWACVCLSSPSLKPRPRGTIQSVSQLDYRSALEPLTSIAEKVIEPNSDGERGSLLYLLGPGENLSGVLGQLVMFLMQFERTRKGDPPAVTLVMGVGPREVPSSVLQPGFQALIAEAQALSPVTRSGELVARPEVIELLGMQSMCQALPKGRAAPIHPLSCWRFVRTEST